MRAFACVFALLVAPAACLTKEAYAKKVADFRESTSKDRFIEQLNTDADKKMEGTQADRMWSYFEEQLDEGRVIFTEDGSVKFSHPPLHAIAPYLPIQIVDVVEYALKMVRNFFGLFFELLPHSAQDKHNDAIEWLNDSGTLHIMLGGVAAFTALSVLRCIFFRFTSDTSPETKRLAAQYDEMMKKKQI